MNPDRGFVVHPSKVITSEIPGNMIPHRYHKIHIPIVIIMFSVVDSFRSIKSSTEFFATKMFPGTHMNNENNKAMVAIFMNTL